jgi:hypothetical protein
MAESGNRRAFQKIIRSLVPSFAAKNCPQTRRHVAASATLAKCSFVLFHGFPFQEKTAFFHDASTVGTTRFLGCFNKCFKKEKKLKTLFEMPSGIA